MPLSEASLMTVSSALRSDGFITITFTPAEIRFRTSAIWPLGPVVRLAEMILETTPDALAWALIEQIISSRKSLSESLLWMATSYFLVQPVEVVSPSHADARKPATTCIAWG